MGHYKNDIVIKMILLQQQQKNQSSNPIFCVRERRTCSMESGPSPACYRTY